MTHTVCGQPVVWHDEFLPPNVWLRKPFCPQCNRYIPDDAELSAGRPWELVEDDAAPETR